MKRHDPLCPSGAAYTYPAMATIQGVTEPVDVTVRSGPCHCDLIEKVIQRTISTTDKTWGERARRAKDELRIVKAQRDLLAERSGLPVPQVNGQTWQ